MFDGEFVGAGVGRDGWRLFWVVGLGRWSVLACHVPLGILCEFECRCRCTLFHGVPVLQGWSQVGRRAVCLGVGKTLFDGLFHLRLHFVHGCQLLFAGST